LDKGSSEKTGDSKTSTPRCSPDFTILGLDSMLKIVSELVKIRQALDEIQMLAENRAAQLKREQKYL
jgi:hypothetical protein